MKLELPGDAGDLIRGHGNEYKLRRSKQPITNPGLLVKQHSPRCGQVSKPDASKSTTAVLDSPFPGTLPVGHFLTCASTTWETPVVETNEIRSNIKYSIIVFFKFTFIQFLSKYYKLTVDELEWRQAWMLIDMLIITSVLSYSRLNEICRSALLHGCQ